jgi:hypothetical protein
MIPAWQPLYPVVRSTHQFVPLNALQRFIALCALVKSSVEPQALVKIEFYSLNSRAKIFECSPTGPKPTARVSCSDNF